MKKNKIKVKPVLVNRTGPKLRTMRVFSRHPSHRSLRDAIKLPFLALIRFGSTTRGVLPYAVEINSPEGVKNSSNKLLMKRCFAKAGVKTAEWVESNSILKAIKENTLTFPIVAKHNYGSRGEGNYLLKNEDEYTNWCKGKTIENYIFETYKSFVREYRLHLSELGCFYACRKMLKEGTPDKEKWHRHDSNSVWILENNPSFDKPTNWDAIIAEGVKAIKAVGLNIGCIDLRVQSAKDSRGRVRENPEFIVIETNSAPSFGDITEQKYKEHIPLLAKHMFVK